VPTGWYAKGMARKLSTPRDSRQRANGIAAWSFWAGLAIGLLFSVVLWAFPQALPIVRGGVLATAFIAVSYAAYTCPYISLRALRRASAGSLVVIAAISWWGVLAFDASHRVMVIVQPIHVAKHSDRRSCVYYALEVIESGTPDDVYFRLQVPSNITTFKVGATVSGVRPSQLYGALFEMGPGCTVIQMNKYSENPNVEAHRTSDQALSVHLGRLPDGASVAGAIGQVESLSKPLYYEGTAEYQEFGSVVAKPVVFEITPMRTIP
jgi:hypothetical protein